MGIYKHIRNVWKKPKENLGPLWKERLIKWRRENATTRIERPTRLDRARSLGYRAKPGFILVRQRVLRGGHTRPKIRGGRRPKHNRQVMSLRKNYKLISEERAQRKYVNLTVLNSYLVAKDGKYYWHEVIMVNPSHPQIISDKIIGWITQAKHRSRVFHGKTSAGKKVRGMAGKGKGHEKARPSRRSNLRRQ
jgi:large subunit ribosomal protein L15e